MNNPITQALYVILKSLIRLLFHNGMAFAEFSNLAKQAYVEVAADELLAVGEKDTTSQIAVVTGLTRKDVSALRKTPEPLASVQQKNRAVRVIAAWASDPDFANTQNILPIHGKTGFAALVARYSGDMPYRAVLKELIRVGAVKERADDTVELVQAAYIPAADDKEKYALLGTDVAALVETISHNILSTTQLPRFQRKVCYEQVPDPVADAFQTFAQGENQKLLLTLNQWLQHHVDTNTEAEKTRRVGVGVYYFENEHEG